MHFICPLCQQPLQPQAQGLGCVNRHHFDRAREGYFNLLPVQHKNSREPGDAKTQLQARRKFLLAGYFSPLLPKLLEVVPDSAKTLLDIGCGEGFFTDALRHHLGQGAEVYGVDIAKAAVKLAAKHYPGCYAVASSYALPLADHSMDVITRIYAPSCDAELNRVLAPHGRIILITPAARHLIGLREQIYQEVRPHQQPQNPEGFYLSHRVHVSFELTIPAGEMTGALLGMTPFAWRLAPALSAHLVEKGIQDLADFDISVYTHNVK